jgi:hypothetical protein
VISQQNLKTQYYSIPISDSNKFEKLNSVHEKDAYIDVFKVTDSSVSSLKYIIYMMSNKLILDIDDFSKINLEYYFQDIGENEIIKSSVFKVDDRENFEIDLKLKDENILAKAYLTHINNVLYRVIFMIPKKYYSNSINEVNTTFISTKLLRTKWIDNNGLD